MKELIGDLVFEIVFMKELSSDNVLDYFELGLLVFLVDD